MRGDKGPSAGARSPESGSDCGPRSPARPEAGADDGVTLAVQWFPAPPIADELPAELGPSLEDHQRNHRELHAEFQRLRDEGADLERRVAFLEEVRAASLLEDSDSDSEEYLDDNCMKVALRQVTARALDKLMEHIGQKAPGTAWWDYLFNACVRNPDWFEERSLGFGELTLLEKMLEMWFSAGNATEDAPAEHLLKCAVTDAASWTALCNFPTELQQDFGAKDPESAWMDYMLKAYTTNPDWFFEERGLGYGELAFLEDGFASWFDDGIAAAQHDPADHLMKYAVTVAAKYDPAWTELWNFVDSASL